MEIYQDWIHDWDRELHEKTPECKILLLQDNFSGHVVPDGLKNIRVENFQPNLTSHVQPDDQGIIRCFKAHYCRLYIQCCIDWYDSGVTPAEIYYIDQLEAMWLADIAWKEVEAMTVLHCWRKAGILPNNTNTPAVAHDVSSSIPSLFNLADPLSFTEKDVKCTIDSLQSRGVLQPSNHMGIENLLNPVQERDFMNDDSGNDENGIYKAVMNAVNAREMSEVNGGDDDTDNDCLLADPCPSRCEAMAAVSVVQCCIWDVDEPFARKLE